MFFSKHSISSSRIKGKLLLSDSYIRRPRRATVPTNYALWKNIWKPLQKAKKNEKTAPTCHFPSYPEILPVSILSLANPLSIFQCDCFSTSSLVQPFLEYAVASPLSPFWQKLLQFMSESIDFRACLSRLLRSTLGRIHQSAHITLRSPHNSTGTLESQKKS